jgi:hypothetical protein
MGNANNLIYPYRIHFCALTTQISWLPMVPNLMADSAFATTTPLSTPTTRRTKSFFDPLFCTFNPNAFAA